MGHVNASGDACCKGNEGYGGWTGLSAHRLWYCGKGKNQCRCGWCDGVCGPSNGCPCDSCLQLLVDGVAVSINDSSDIVVKGSRKGGNAGWIGLPPSEVWYCGRRKNQCKCGRCDGQCGPTNGCPCDDCFQLLVSAGVVALNRSGDPAIKGVSTERDAGWTGLPTSEVWYCGRRKNQCKCGRCDGRCGPTNGCPCDDCAALLPPPPPAAAEARPAGGGARASARPERPGTAFLQRARPRMRCAAPRQRANARPRRRARTHRRQAAS